MKLEGTLTALITPFNEDGSLDLNGLEELIHFQMKSGVNGLVIIGTTGESNSLTAEEEKLIITKAVTTAKGQIPIIVGTGTSSTLLTIEKTKMVKDLGADAAIIVTPYYNKPTQEGLFLHYEAICRAVNFPILLYNNPSRTACNLDPSTIARIASFPHIIGMKECGSQMAETLKLLPHFTIFSGDDVNALTMIALGAKGLVSAVSNLFPEKIVTMVDLALQEQFAEARKIYYEFLPFIKAAFIETSPSPIKEAMNLLGLPAGSVRLPLSKLKNESKKILENALPKWDESNLKAGK